MSAKIVVAVCAQVLLIQATLSQRIPFSSLAGNTVLGNTGNNIFVGNSANNIASGIKNLGVLGGGLASGAGNSAVTGLSGLSGLNIVSSGPLAVTSISPIGPSGLAVASENTIEGILNVSGQLPFLSAVAFDGSLPTAGSGIATCGCGTGTVGIISEGLGQAYGRPGFGGLRF